MLMIFEISPEEFDSMPSNDKLKLINKVVASSVAGNHKFVIPVELTVQMRKCKGLTEDVKKHLITLEDSSNFEELNLDELKHVYLVVQFGGQESSIEPPFKITIGHTEFMNGNYLSQTKLVVENKDSDGKLYSLILNNLKNLNKHRMENMSFEIVGGEEPGIGIGRKFVQLIDKKNIVCCICDSDKRAPAYREGDTYLQIKNKLLQKNYIGHFDCTPCLESENFFSIKIIDKLVQKDGTREVIKLVDKIRKLIRTQENAGSLNCLWLFVDIKDGIVGAELDPKYITGPVEEWLCSKYQKNSVNEIDVPGISESILENFFRTEEEMGLFYQHMRSSYWKRHFAKWFEEFIWYFYCQETSKFEDDSFVDA